MPSTATIRDLRNRFPQVRRILELEGEVVLTESGKARYRLTPYVLPPKKTASPIDYWARLTSYQPAPMTAAQARELYEENRGDR
jgi:antitoxin (DNA-binding transcriptional repressor) of toxin-antitoxin stability system